MKQRIRTAESKVNKMSQASPAPLVKNQNSTKKVRSKKSMTAKIIILIVILSTLSALPAFALGWSRGMSKNAWWYDLGNGNFLKSTWQWLDGNNDGISECYRFDYLGWMAENTVTPDGYTVNQNGAWTVNNVVQIKFNSRKANAYHEKYLRNKDSFTKEVLARINEYRASISLSPLGESESLNAIAETRAKECAILFSHNRPQGGSVFMEADVCGEILAKNQSTPARVVQAWKNSSGHNEVMVRSDFLRFGSGYYVDGEGNDYWVVLFSY